MLSTFIDYPTVFANYRSMREWGHHTEGGPGRAYPIDCPTGGAGALLASDITPSWTRADALALAFYVRT